MINNSGNIVDYLYDKSSRDDILIGYVIVPPDFPSREDYIDECKRHSTLSVVLETGSIVHDVLTPISIMNILTGGRDADGFPKDGKVLGDCVLLNMLPRQNFPIVVQIYPKRDEKNEDAVGEVDNTISTGGNMSGIQSMATTDKSSASLFAHSDKSGEGNVDISASNVYKNAIMRIYGDRIIKQANKYILNQIFDENGIHALVYLDNQKNLKIWAGNTIDLGLNFDEDSSKWEWAVKGRTLVDLLSKLIDQINTITVPTAFGPSGVPINAPEFTKIKNELESMLSNVVRIGDGGNGVFPLSIEESRQSIPEINVDLQKMTEFHDRGAFNKDAAVILTRQKLDEWLAALYRTKGLTYNRDRDIKTTSSYRNPQENFDAGRNSGAVASTTSQHMIGEAIDFQSLNSNFTNKEIFDFLLANHSKEKISDRNERDRFDQVGRYIQQDGSYRWLHFSYVHPNNRNSVWKDNIRRKGNQGTTYTSNLSY